MSTTIERITAELATVEEQILSLETERRRIALALAELRGDTLEAEWLRCVLDGRHEEGHQAWVRMMAAMPGTEACLSTEERDRDAIRAAMKGAKP